MIRTRRYVVGLLVVGFAIGTFTHAVHLFNVGWVVFSSAPVWMNVYWTALVILDPVAAMLLIRTPRAGLALGLAIMVSDVAVNSYALHCLGLPFLVAPLQLQTLFLGFLLGAFGFLWKKAS